MQIPTFSRRKLFTNAVRLTAHLYLRDHDCRTDVVDLYREQKGIHPRTHRRLCHVLHDRRHGMGAGDPRRDQGDPRGGQRKKGRPQRQKGGTVGEAYSGICYCLLDEEYKVESGFYTVDFFCEGNLIGSFPFQLKK